MVQVLTSLGVHVALLEAGPMLNPARDFKEHLWPYQVDHRGAGESGLAYVGGYAQLLWRSECLLGNPWRALQGRSR